MSEPTKDSHAARGDSAGSGRTGGRTGSGPLLASSGVQVTDELLQLASEIQTVVPRGTWTSLGSEEEIAQENGTTVQRRPLIKVQFEIARQVLLRHRTAHVGFITKEASEDSRDLRGTQNPLYGLTRMEVDAGVQAVPPRQDSAVQTHFARKVNASVQAEPRLVDACIRHMDLPKKESPALSAFLDKVLPRVTHCLTQNYEVPIYTDDYALFKEDEAIVGARDDTVMLEKGNYTHAAVKDRRITCISWRSAHGRDDYVCVASVAPYTLEERLEAQRRCESSVALVWAFSDPMHPRYVLEVPNEIQVLRFSPSQPNLIAGGALNGQVYLWDLSLADDIPFLPTNNNTNAAAAGGAATSSSGAAAAGGKSKTGGGGSTNGVVASNAGNETGEHTNSSSSGGGGGTASDVKDVGEVPPMPGNVKGLTLEMDGDVFVPRLQPIQASRVELSHRRPVHDLQWLPSHLECTFDGKQTVVEASHQFATVSDDGSMYVWDIRLDYLPPDKLRKLKHQTKGSGQDMLWVPLHRYQLTKPDGTGDLMGFRLFFDGLTPDETPSYTVAIGSTNGELANCGMVAKHDRRTSLMVPTFGTTKETRFVRSVVAAHAGPVYCVQRHPVIGDVYLTCGDYSFKVWRAGMPLPLYRSPNMESAVTCAAWSPTRPAVVFIGTSDGKVMVWDLLDRNNEPLLVHHMVQDAITTIAFKPLPHNLSSKFTQHVAFGTNLGSFHWYILPAVLSRAPNGEKRHFRAMLEREVMRATYSAWRQTVRQQEMDHYGAHVPKMQIGTASERGKRFHHGGAANGGAENGEAAEDELEAMTEDEEDDELTNFYAHDPQRDEEFLAKVKELQQLEVENMKVEAL